MLIDLNANYKDYYSPLHIIPKLILGITTIIGIALSLSFKVNTLNYFMFYYFSNIGLFSIFFILPRYSLSLLIIQVIFSMYIIKIKTKFVEMKFILDLSLKFSDNIFSYSFNNLNFFDFFKDTQ